METVSITLAKALKLKNRLVSRLSNLWSDIQIYNSVLEEQRDSFDVAAAYTKVEFVTNSLVDLKAAIFRANEKIERDILLQGELRNKISNLRSISTTDGPQRHGYQNTAVVYVAGLKKNRIDEIIRETEKEIDAIQDRIDEHNHSTKIDLDKAVVALI